MLLTSRLSEIQPQLANLSTSRLHVTNPANFKEALLANFRVGDDSGLIAGQTRCLRHEVIPFRDARCPRSRSSVVFDGSFIVSGLFQ
jgi:hypothetical protein